MYCNVTKQIQTGLNRLWEEASISDQLSKAISVKEYLAVLQEHSNWNTFSFSLRRYIYLRFTQRSPEEEPVSYSVLFERKSYDFTPVTPDAKISEQEMKDYSLVAEDTKRAAADHAHCDLQQPCILLLLNFLLANRL